METVKAVATVVAVLVLKWLTLVALIMLTMWCLSVPVTFKSANGILLLLGLIKGTLSRTIKFKDGGESK